jgi:hypothetical protein
MNELSFKKDVGKIRSLAGCRLNEHRLSAEKITIKNRAHFDLLECIFKVKCHDCNLEFREVWRTSTWFIINCNAKKIASHLDKRTKFREVMNIK